jgi:hypothetical protein
MILFPVISHAGPNFNYEFVPFRMTRNNWNENTLGSYRTVQLGRGSSDVTIRWNVRFHANQSGKEFSSKEGESALSAPAECKNVELYATSTDLLDRMREGDPAEVSFWKLDDRALFKAPGSWGGYRAYASHFPDYIRLDYIKRSKIDLYRQINNAATCEILRSNCVENPEDPVRLRYASSMGLALSKSNMPPRLPLCSDADSAVARCLRGIAQFEARHRAKLAEFEKRSQCMAWVVPAQSFDGGIELRVTGGDGVEWEPIRIEAPKRTWNLRAYTMAPITAVGDVFLMAGEVLFWGALGIGVAIFG